jgi:DNA-binding NtrC family response regulator
MSSLPLPRLLIIDDLFGRQLPDGQVNEDRVHLCGRFLLRDITGDESAISSRQVIKRPIAEVVFFRGQKPVRAGPGDFVENDLEGTMRIVREGWDSGPKRWALILLDLCFYTGRVDGKSQGPPGMPPGQPEDSAPANYFGLTILQAIHRELPNLPVVILSSKPRESSSRAYAEWGALGFLARADDGSRDLLSEFIWRHGLIPDNNGEIVGRSRPLLIALRAARRAGGDRRNVLILGERGTGKELLARYLHRSSRIASGRPLVVVDSGSLSPTLYASELFGYRRGAFTGAERNHPGKILQANGGDLFLDEIGNMPGDVQAGLLRVLEHKSLMPLGSNTEEQADVRFLAATNEDLEGKAATGGFRQDLLDRLREGGTVFLRPLRERPEDLEPLAEAFVREAESAHHSAIRRTIEPETIEKLRLYSWPGNLRELRSCIFSAVFNYPDVEHLMPVHIEIGVGDNRAHSEPERRLLPTPVVSNIDTVLSAMTTFDFNDVRPEDIVGRLDTTESAIAHFLVSLLRAALVLTIRRTPENPEGQPMIHPAVKLLTGNKSIPASKAADIVKRLLALNVTIKDAALADPLLGAAYDKAMRLRPSSSVAKRRSQNVAGQS